MRRLRNLSWSITALLLATPSAISAQQVLELRNGDRLTGMLAGISTGSWTFTLHSGRLQIPVDQVVNFTAPDPVGVRLADGTIAVTTITTVGNALQLALTDGTSRTVQIADLTAVGDTANLDALRPIAVGLFTPFSKFWGATVSFGFANNGGNSRSRGVAFSFDVERDSPRDRQAIKGGLSREFASGESGDLETTVEKYFGSARLDIFLTTKLFTFGFAGYDRDTFQDLDLRQNYTVGFGYQLVQNDETDLRLYASGGARIESFTSGGSTSTGIFGLGSGYRQGVGPFVFDWSVAWAPSVEDIQDYRLVSDASLTATILGGFGFKLASRNVYNNNPRPNVKKHDWLLTTQLTYTVGR